MVPIATVESRIISVFDVKPVSVDESSLSAELHSVSSCVIVLLQRRTFFVDSSSFQCLLCLVTWRGFLLGLQPRKPEGRSNNFVFLFNLEQTHSLYRERSVAHYERFVRCSNSCNFQKVFKVAGSRPFLLILPFVGGCVYVGFVLCGD